MILAIPKNPKTLTPVHFGHPSERRWVIIPWEISGALPYVQTVMRWALESSSLPLFCRSSPFHLV